MYNFSVYFSFDMTEFYCIIIILSLGLLMCHLLTIATLYIYVALVNDENVKTWVPGIFFLCMCVEINEYVYLICFKLNDLFGIDK